MYVKKKIPKMFIIWLVRDHPSPYLSYKYVVFLRIFKYFSMNAAAAAAHHFIHLRYGIDKRMEVMTLDPRHFTTARDVLRRVKYKFQHSIIRLYNEHGIKLRPGDVVERSRVYTIKRHPR